MTALEAPPLKVVVIGNSVPLLVIPPRTERDDGTYGEVLERRLLDAGVAATVENQARLFELIHEGSVRFRRDLVGRFPDVLVIHFGILEMQPNVAPYQVVRYLTRDEPPAVGTVARVWQKAMKRVWPAVRNWQRWASARAGLRSWRVPPARFGEHLLHLVRLARSTGALVLVVDVHRPNARLEHFMPGMTERWEVFLDAMRGSVAAAGDPDVRLVEASKLVDGCDDPPGTYDGLHLTAPVHAALADLLADEILRWRQP